MTRDTHRGWTMERWPESGRFGVAAHNPRTNDRLYAPNRDALIDLIDFHERLAEVDAAKQGGTHAQD